jgi:hypothetical protein
MKKKLFNTISQLAKNKDYDTLKRGAKIAAIAGCIYDNSFVKKTPNGKIIYRGMFVTKDGEDIILYRKAIKEVTGCTSIEELKRANG